MRVGHRDVDAGSCVTWRSIRKAIVYLVIHWVLDVLTVAIALHQLVEGSDMSHDIDDFESMWE